MLDNKLCHANPFLAAIQLYLSDTISKAEATRRVDALFKVTKQLVNEDTAEHADIFLALMSNRVVKFYPEKLLQLQRYNINDNATNIILNFAGRANTTEKEFFLILERSALLWEELDGDIAELWPLIKPKPPLEILPDRGTTPQYEAVIDIVSNMLDVLYDPRVTMISTPQGIRIHLPPFIYEDLFDGYSMPSNTFSIEQYLRHFPCPDSASLFVIKQIVMEIKKLDLRPVIVWDNPLADFSEREDATVDMLLILLGEVIQTAKDQIEAIRARKAIIPYAGNPMSEMFEAPTYEMWGC